MVILWTHWSDVLLQSWTSHGGGWFRTMCARGSLRSIPINQNCCHQCLLNRLGSVSGIAESSRPVIRTGNFFAYQCPGALCHLQCLAGPSSSHQRLCGAHLYQQCNCNVLCEQTEGAHSNMLCQEAIIRENIIPMASHLPGSRINWWITSAEISH